MLPDVAKCPLQPSINNLKKGKLCLYACVRYQRLGRLNLSRLVMRWLFRFSDSKYYVQSICSLRSTDIGMDEGGVDSFESLIRCVVS
jgi:hypothetical protein